MMLTLCVIPLCFSDVTELHVHHAQRQQSHRCKALFRCHGGALHKEHMVSIILFISTLDIILSKTL